MESGTVSLTGATDDGIQVELDTNNPSTGITTDHEDENTGNFYMLDGTLTISAYQGKAIKTDGIITYSGGMQNFDKTDTQEQASATGIKKVSVATSDTQVYDLNGRAYASSQALPKGVYLVRRDGKTSKVLVK